MNTTSASGEWSSAKPSMLDGVRVIELADERAEYVGLVLAGLGAEVIKIEPPSGSRSRQIGPFYHGAEDGESSLFFWQYNRGKRSISLDLDDEDDRATFLSLAVTADVLLDSSPLGRLEQLGIDVDGTRRGSKRLIIARMTAFGDCGPWMNYAGSDLVHLALGGVMMNCGYDPRPDGSYDLPPIAPAMWHSFHIAGESLLIGILAALFHRERSGSGQYISLAIHDAVSKNTELDLMNWVMRRVPLHRQTCRHAAERVSWTPTIQQTKDGRWYMLGGLAPRDRKPIAEFMKRYGLAVPVEERNRDAPSHSRDIPGSFIDSETTLHVLELFQRLVRKYTYSEFPWKDAQAAGVLCVPLRYSYENLDDEHWQIRRTYTSIKHPEVGRSFHYVTSKWQADNTEWKAGRRAPLLNEDRHAILDAVVASQPKPPAPVRSTAGDPTSASREPSTSSHTLNGIRILDFTWFLASAGGTRFLSALGAESIKVEWSANPDTRMGAMAPIGGRAARKAAVAPLGGVADPDMGGQFNNKNAGKRGISLNVKHPRGLEIAKELVRVSDIVAEGFSPGVMDSWGLGYDVLKQLRPGIIYAQQSGMGTMGTYGRFRAVGPIAASLAGQSEMSGLPSPNMPAGWGYSYLDWIAAYSFATAMLAALIHRERTGEGQWIDASQTETGIFIGGTALLEWEANGVTWARYGNDSPHDGAAPHGVFRCQGADHWVAIACYGDEQFASLAKVFEHPEWVSDERFATTIARKLNASELGKSLESFTCGRDRYEVMHALQANGVPAGACQTAEDRVESDPQLAALEWLREVKGTKIGTWPVAELPVKMSVTPSLIGGDMNRGAPIYGEDNEYVYGELLGFSPRELEELRRERVI
jgi:crotonobetainyl-CoA:carnitine CoA-transferase CaiB-like acyl-CoA transferase